MADDQSGKSGGLKAPVRSTAAGMQLSLCLPVDSEVRVALTDGSIVRKDGFSNDNFANRDLEDLRRYAAHAEVVFRQFLAHIGMFGFESLASFMRAPESAETRHVIATWLQGQSRSNLLDGTGRQYDTPKSRWLFAGWVFREAPEQRLKPLVRKAQGSSTAERQAVVLDSVRAFAGRIFVEDEEWSWPVIRETIRHRLEGSRRARLGCAVEKVVREEVHALGASHELCLEISESECRFDGVTVDVVVRGVAGRILMPVKSRTTEGGGHGLLYTRDLAQALSNVAKENDVVMPVIVAERFSAGIAEIGAGDAIVIDLHPSDPRVRRRIREALALRLHHFLAVSCNSSAA